MKQCPKCNAQYPDEAGFCTACGTPLSDNAQPAATPAQPQAPVTDAAQPQTQAAAYTAPAPYVDPSDHTSEFDPSDISDNKVLAMTPYLIGWIGIIVCLLAMNHSQYAAFHVKQALKIEVISTLLSIIMVVLCWTLIVPIVGLICQAILLVVKIICFFQVCGNKAKEPPIVNAFTFLK